MCHDRLLCALSEPCFPDRNRCCASYEAIGEIILKPMYSERAHRDGNLKDDGKAKTVFSITDCCVTSSIAFQRQEVRRTNVRDVMEVYEKKESPAKGNCLSRVGLVLFQAFSMTVAHIGVLGRRVLRLDA